MTIPFLKRLLGSQSGSSLVEMSLVLPMLVVFFLGVADLGRAFYYSNEIARAANAGALYGTQYPTDTSGIIQAAKSDAPDVPDITATTSYGCECSDGTGQSPDCNITPSCSANTNEVYYTTVTAAAPYSTLLPWPDMPSSWKLTYTVTMQNGG